jgi:heme/copper-type cytochrome/quinol oxidase subunit 2
VTVGTSWVVTVLGVVVVSVSVVVVVTVWARLGGKNVANATKQHVTNNTPNSILWW